MAEDSNAFVEITDAASLNQPTILEHTQSSLTQGATYKFKVSAYNQIGESALTNQITVIAADTPVAPINPIDVTEVTKSYISLEITETIEDGGSPITGYIIEMDDGLSGEFTQVHNSLVTIVTISNLQSSRNYRIRYAARNIVYDSNNMFECDKLHFSPIVTVLTAVEPTEPYDLIHNTDLRFRESVIIDWKAPLDDGGSPLQLYTIQITDVDAGSFYTEQITVQANSKMLLNLESGFEYTIKVRVNNLVGDSPWSDEITVYPGIEPTRPGLLSFDSTTRITLTLSWLHLAGEDTGGTSANPLVITAYEIYMDNGLGGDFTLISSDESISSYTVPYMVPGLSYRFKLRA